MDDNLWIYGTNFYDTDMRAGDCVAIVDASQVPGTVPVRIDKVFRIRSRGERWLPGDCGMMALRHPQLIDRPARLVACVYSPADKVGVEIDSDNGDRLFRSLQFGGWPIVPNQWNEIVLDVVPGQSGRALLQTFKVYPMQRDIDVYVCFYWDKGGE